MAYVSFGVILFFKLITSTILWYIKNHINELIYYRYNANVPPVIQDSTLNCVKLVNLSFLHDWTISFTLHLAYSFSMFICS